jgi:hypothetical protein
LSSGSEIAGPTLRWAEGEEVTLMAWGNAFIDKIHRGPAAPGDAAPGPVTAVEARLHLAGDFKKTRLKLTWLAEEEEGGALPSLELHYFGYLLTKRKLEEGDEFEDFVNRDSVSAWEGARPIPHAGPPPPQVSAQTTWSSASSKRSRVHYPVCRLLATTRVGGGGGVGGWGGGAFKETAHAV